MEEHHSEPALEPHTPQEGKGMKRLTYVLVLLSVILLGLAFAQNSTDTSEEGADEAPSSVVDTMWQGGAAPELHHLEVLWVYSPAVENERMYPQVTRQTPYPSQCEIGFGQMSLDEPSAYLTAAYVGYCFHGAWLDAPYGEPWRHEPARVHEFASAYAEAYIEKCGEVFAPLGFGGVEDSSCEPPVPSDVAGVLYGWETP